MASPPIVLKVSEYAPDMPNYMSGQSDTVLNVIPRTPLSYGPLSSPAALGTAQIGARCQGAYFGLDSGGNVAGFAGDINNLYQYTVASAAWDNVSKTNNVYNCAAEDKWQFSLFGQRVIAHNINDPIQSYIFNQSTDFADMVTTANPPKARYSAVVKSFYVLCGTSDPIYGAQPQRVWWSRNGDPTKFDAPGSATATQFQTSFQDLLGEGGFINGIVGSLGTADAAIFMDHAIYRMVWSGGPTVFDFFPAQGARGTPAPGSIAQLGSIAYYLGEDGFYAFDGTNSKPIGANKVDKTFYTDLDQTYISSVCSAIDPINKLYIVGYPGSGHSGNLCNKFIMYNWQLDRWSPALPLPAGFEIIARALSFGYTLDQLYTILGYTLDNLPFILDSRVWQGGALLLGMFDSNHRLNFFTGSSLAATVQTSEIQPTPGRATKIRNTRPIIDGGTPSVAIGTRNRQVDSVAYNTAIAMDALGQSPQRAVGRYIRAQVTVPAGSSWSHISGVELEGAPSGARY